MVTLASPKRSPCCSNTTSSPASHSPSRRERSITRQKQVINRTGNSRQSCRSKSSSPPKTSNRISTSANSDRRHATSPKSKEIAPPLKTSETADVEKVEILNPNRTITNAYVVNTHSKTPHFTPNETRNVSKYESPRNIKKTSSISPPRPNSSETPPGYGKAIVTPVNKRLVLQRDNRPGSDKNSICFGRKQTSTTSWKENRHSSIPTPISSREASKPKLPTKEISSANEKIRGYTQSDPKSLYPKDTTANRTLCQSITPQRTSLSPRRQSVERKCYETRNLSPNTKIKTADSVYSQQNARPLNSGTPLSKNFSKNRIPVLRRESPTKEIPNPTQAITQSRCNSRENLNGKLQRPPFCRNIKSTTSNIIHSNRSFKPQLEDIKSSYLLLNQKEIEKNIKNQVNNGTIVSKPPPLTEDRRQSILQHAMKKYKTKQFWNDSKYDKIEGLNWISWK